MDDLLKSFLTSDAHGHPDLTSAQATDLLILDDNALAAEPGGVDGANAILTETDIIAVITDVADPLGTSPVDIGAILP
jgi:hypothetical protein